MQGESALASLAEGDMYLPIMRPLSRRVRLHWRCSTIRRAGNQDKAYSHVVKAAGWPFSLANRQVQ